MKHLSIKLLAAGVALTAATVSAQTVDISVPAVPLITSVNAVTEVNTNLKIESLARTKLRGDTLIKARINSLNKNKAAIDKSNLTVEQKAALNAKIATNLTGLATLNASIASGSDATSTKSLVQNIYTNFRIYAVALPQIRLEKRIYELQNHTAKLGTTFATAQVKINEQKALGKDVTAWQASLDNAKLVVASDTAKLGGLFAQTEVLKPSDYGTTSKSVIESVNKDLKLITKDFESLRKTLKRPYLHMMVNASTTVR